MAVEIVGIELELRGANAVYTDLQKIDNLLRSFGGRKAVKTGMDQLKRDILAGERELQKMQSEIRATQREFVVLKSKAEASANAMKKWGKAFENSSASYFAKKNIQAADEMAAKLRRQQQEARGLASALREDKQALQELKLGSSQAEKSFRQMARGVTSSLSSLGGRITTLGKALGRIVNPLSTLLRGTLLAAGWKMLNMFTEGIRDSFERADTMKLYPKMLAEFGFSAEESAKAVSTLEEAVLGLPTGLDEIVAVQKRFLAASQDMDKATGLAIAFNNAILASGADARQSWTAQRIITQLAGGAEIAATSWDALQRAIPLVFTELSKDANMGVGDYVNALKKGKISTEEFMEAFTKIGGEGGTIAAVAQKMTKSWEGFSSNLKNATKRMGTAILDALHDVFKEKTGRDLLDTLLGIDAEGNRTYDGIRDWIDGISQSIQDWIRENPDTIIDFFETLKSIDIKGLLKGIAQGFGDILSIAKQLAENLDGKDLSKLGRYYTWLLPISKILTTAGGLLKGLSPILGILAIGVLRGFRGKGIFATIAALFGSKAAMTAAAGTATAVPTVAGTFKAAFSALQGVLVAAGAIVLVTGSAAFGFKAIKSVIKDLKEIGEELKDFEAIDGYAATGILAGIGVFIEIFNGIGALLADGGLLNVAIAAAASFIVAGTFAADLWAIKTGVEQLRDTVLAIDEVAAAIDNMKGFTDLKGATQKISAAVNAISEIVGLFHGESANHKEGVERKEGLAKLGKGEINTIKNLADAVKNIQTAIKELNKMASLGIATNVRSKAQQMMRAMQDVMDGFANFTWSTSSTKNLKKNASNLADAMKNLIKLSGRLNTLAGTDIDVTGFGAYVQKIKDALAELDGMDEVLEIDVEVKLSDGFKTSVDGVVKSINDARNKIAQESNKAVNVSIPVNVKFRVKTNTTAAINAISTGASAVRRIAASAISPTYPAKGGLIYRAKGGGVPFKRRGTDSVPAMLTPGEYVHNKRAVNMFGIDFMRKVNSLDMKGAMNELMRRAGGMANVNRGTTITNNTYNNQRATINVTTNSAEFTGRLASRFVGAF